VQDYRAIVDRIRGPLAPVLPAFAADEKLDLDSTCKWADWVVGQGMPLLWLTPGTSRYACLTDQEVFDFTQAIGQAVKDRCIFIAATNRHWPVHQVRKYIEHAADVGADVVKVNSSWLHNPSFDRSVEFHQAVAADSPLPLFAYTASVRGSAGMGMTTELLDRILDMPQYVGMKNDSGDFYEHRAYLATIKKHGARFTPMTGGSMMSFLWGCDFGAQAFCSAYGIMAPQTPIAFYDHLIASRRDEALAIVKDEEEVLLDAWVDFGGWYGLRAALVFMGLYPSWQERYPFTALTDDQAEKVKAYLVQKELL